MSATQAKAVFETLAASAGEMIAAGITSRVQQAGEDEQKLAAIFGAPLNNEIDAELFAARVAIGQISSILNATLDISPEDAKAQGGDAKPQASIVLRRSPEAVLSRFFKSIDPQLLNEVLGRPGVVESIAAEESRFEINFFDDGSLLCRIDKSAENNGALFAQICDAARDPSQLALDEPDKIKAIEAQFNQLREHIAKEADLSDGARAELPAIFKNAIVSLFKAISQKQIISAPFDTPAELVKTLASHQNSDGSWVEGVSVEANGAACPNASSLAQALGAPAPITLEGAMERLRQSREPAAATAPKSAAKTAAKSAAKRSPRS